MKIKIPSLVTIAKCLLVRRRFWHRKFLWLPKRKDHCTVLWLTYIARRKVPNTREYSRNGITSRVTSYIWEIDWNPKPKYDYLGPKIRYYLFYEGEYPPNPPAL